MSLNFKQDTSNSNPDNPWIGLRTYQLTPWPERCVIIYYDLGPRELLKPGYVAEYWFENGHAEYRIVRDINEDLGCDWECELLPGSTWEPPPTHIQR